MQLDQSLIAHLSSTSGSQMQMIEEYSGGITVSDAPSAIVLEELNLEEILRNPPRPRDTDTERVTERQLNSINRRSEDFNVFLDDDKVDCTSCGSPEASYRCVKVFSSYDRKLKVSTEVGERLRKLCNPCFDRYLDHSSAIVTHDELRQRWCDKNGVRWYEPKITPVDARRDVTAYVYNPIGRDGLSSLGYAGQRNHKGRRGIDKKVCIGRREYWNDGRKIKSIVAKPRENTRYISLRLV